MPGPFTTQPASSTSSSSRSPNRAHTPADTTDDDALASLWDDDAPEDLLAEDPLSDAPREPLTFKRKPKLSGPARLFSALGGGSSSRNHDDFGPDDSHDDDALGGNRSPPRGEPRRAAGAPKDGGIDWYADGPGRRVAYEDLTAIDWIFEYTKERQRLRQLRSGARGILGQLQLLADASQVWIVLILTGVAVGAIAAGIDVTTNWLADLKTGFCSGGADGGAFYLNKAVCCLGYDMGSKCSGWLTWGEAVGIQGAGGRWFLGYIFFIMFSVRSQPGALTLFWV